MVAIFQKYLNGYNTSLLPVLGLVLFLGGVFPLIYVLLGVVSNYTNGLLHSLYLVVPAKGSDAGHVLYTWLARTRSVSWTP